MTSKVFLGIDPASTTAGIALLSGKKFALIEIWQRDKSKSLSQNLFNFYVSLGKYFPVDLVVVERLHAKLNMDTTRKIAYFEGAAIMKAAEHETPFLPLGVGSARKLAHGKGNLTKQEVYDINSKKRKLLPFKKGGSDQSDAMTLALAGREYYVQEEKT